MSELKSFGNDFFTIILYATEWISHVSGFIAQLVRASHRYREVMGSNPVEVLTFSGFDMQFA